MSNQIVQELSNYIWNVADLLRGPYRRPQYERVMLPMTVLRRFDYVLEDTKPAVLERFEELKRIGKFERLGDRIDKDLNLVAGNIGFHNRSKQDFKILLGDPNNIKEHFMDYLNGFSFEVREIFRHFDFEKEIERLLEADRLFMIVREFAKMDLHPSRIKNIDMGLLFEDLIRRFNEDANETAGDHFTPREVIRLMVNLLLEPDTEILTKDNKIITIYDPTCGTGGMLSEGQNWILEHNPKAEVFVYGQDYNPRSYAVAASDLLMKGNQRSHIALGNTLTNDQFRESEDSKLPSKFDYLLANPPFGVDWKGQQQIIENEHQNRGYAGRFGPKLPRVNDGALLFLLHMVAKFEPINKPNTKLENAPLFNNQKDNGGSRAAVVFNGSPLFTGGAGSGESEIRRWMIENDWLEAIVALPEQMFYNTGIGTFVWIVTNRKVKERKHKIQLIDARERWTPMRRSLGDKRRYLNDQTIVDITREHGAFVPSQHCKIFDSKYFGYRRITVERPLRLRFQITREAKEIFLDAAPEYLDLIRILEPQFGNTAHHDWNIVRDGVETLVKKQKIKWTAKIRKFFRDVFTQTDPLAAPVIKETGHFAGSIGQIHFPDHSIPAHLTQTELDEIFGITRAAKTKKDTKYEPDPKLRDSENVPLSEDIATFFLREVRPFVPDAWIDPDAADEKDGGAGKKGYEINFNREFFKYDPPRALEVIDQELSEVEARILKLLSAVTH